MTISRLSWLNSNNSTMSKIYLDNNASTPVDQQVLQAVIQSLSQHMGNPSSIHSFGRETRQGITRARSQVADFLGVKAREIVFTSGGTEAVNAAIRGFCQAAIQGHSSELSQKGSLMHSPGHLSGCSPGHIITTDLEHACMYQTLKEMQRCGWEVTFLSAGLWGAATPQAIKQALQPNTRLIALTAVNSETGVKTDIDEIALIALHAQVPFVVDGVALLGKEAFIIPKGVSAMCFSGHKLHAPKGIGAAFIRQTMRVAPLITGGEQELGRRAGTENVSGIMGFAMAIDILTSALPSASQKMAMLRDRFEQGILGALPEVWVNGQGARVVNTSNLAFSGIDGESLLMLLDSSGVAASHGSACSSGALEPSRVLLNMGLPMELARASLRFSFSRMNTVDEIDRAVLIVVKIVRQLREMRKKGLTAI